MKFKVGDHVKAIKYIDSIINENLIDAEVMDEVRPIDGSLLSGKMRIKYIRFLNGDIKETGKSFWVNPEDFDYAGIKSDNTNPSFNLKINENPYISEQFTKDYRRFIKAFPEKNIELSHALEDMAIVYQWAQKHPSNLDFYANKYHWTEEQKENIRKHGASLPNFMNPFSSDNSKEWWEDEEYDAD